MAKKRTVDPTIEEPANSIENTEVSVNETETVEIASDVPVKKAKNKAEGEIPDNVKPLLQTFNKYPELLITKDGGVFTPDTKLPEHKGAILYKNPFYNS